MDYKVITLLRTFTFIIFITFSLDSISAKNESDLPPILDYYPNCSYKILEVSTAKLRSDTPYEAKITTKLLRILQKKAQTTGADAIILQSKKYTKQTSSKKYLDGSRYNTYLVSYDAEFIKLCHENSTKNRQLTPYDHNGNKSAIISKRGTFITSEIEISPKKKLKLKRPRITNTDISLKNGIYGIKLGSSYQQIITEFGDPSVELDILENEFIIGYGRHHWLHFQSGKLVKVQTKPPFMSINALNKIPLLDIFDDYKWTVENELTYKSNLNKVRLALNIYTPLNKSNQLSLKDQNNTLTLNFRRGINPLNGKNNYILNGFSLQTNDYNIHKIKPLAPQKSHYQAIDKIFLKLQQNQELNWKEFNAQFGNPIARIALTYYSSLNIYNQNLIIERKSSEWLTVYFMEGLFLPNIKEYSSVSSWNLLNFRRGKSLEQLRKHFPENAFELEYKVSIDSNRYGLSLYFDEINGQNLLYQAELTFY